MTNSSYQGLHSILFLHLLSQLLEAGFHAVMERPQCFRDLISMDADPLSKVRNLGGGAEKTAFIQNSLEEQGVSYMNNFVDKKYKHLKDKFNDLAP